jgi:hypothetical protein
MNFQFYFEKLKEANSYKDFIKKEPEAFLSSCFFVIDKEEQDNKQHFDYFNKDKFFSFQLEQDCKLVPVDVPETKKPSKLPSDLDLDFNEIEKLVLGRMIDEKINNKIQKFLFSLQNINNKILLNGTVFISMLGMIRISIDVENMKILDFEKKNFFDIMKVSKKDKK